MPARTIGIALLASLLLGPNGAAACDTVTGNADASPLHTRRPVQGDEVRLTTGFGLRRHPILSIPKMHTGIDWSAPTGTPVLAAGGGQVLFAGLQGENGNAVLIDHGAGWRTLYAHLSGFDVREGDCVAPLTVIGKVGSTGLSWGPHVHFEVHANGEPVDPLRLPSKEPASADESK